MSSRTEPRGGAWTVLLAATVLVALVLRVVGLQSGLWYDEIVTLVESARLPLSRILTNFPYLNVHPLYSVLAHVSIATFGESPWALRFPALVFGVASVPMAYVLAVRLTTPLEAWAGAAVLATSYHHIWFSQNARGYTLMGFLTLWGTLVLLKALEHNRTRDYVIYALVAAAGVYTHLTMVFVVVGHALAVAVAQMIGRHDPESRHARPAVFTFLGAGALSAVAYAPFISGLLAQMTADAPHKAAQVATASWALSEAVRSLLAGAGVPAAIAGGLFAAVGALSLLRTQPFAVGLLATPALVTAVSMVVLGQPLRPRFFFFLSGAAAIFVGRGIGAAVQSIAATHLSPYRIAVAVVACTVTLVAASAIALPRNYRLPKQDYDGALRFLEDEEARGARVAITGPACYPFRAYYGKAWKCLEVVDDWNAYSGPAGRALLAYTLVDYIDDPGLRAIVRADCPAIRRFAGTLGGGDIVVCEAR